MPLLDRYLPVRWRGAAFVPAGVLAVHQLRYQLAFGGQSGHELSAQGHAYLSSLAPPIALLFALGFGLTLANLAQAWRSGRVRRSPSHPLLALWLLVSAGLVAVYIGQESLEGLLSSGHPGGLAGVFGDGGWLAIPAALAVGGLIALVLRGASAAERWAARRSRSFRQSRRRTIATPRPLEVWISRPEPLASEAAGRAPPRVAPTFV